MTYTPVMNWSRAVGEPEHAEKSFVRKLGDLDSTPDMGRGWGRQGQKPYSCHLRWREVGYIHTT